MIIEDKGVEYLKPEDPRARDFSGTIRLWSSAAEHELEGVVSVECELLDVVASPKGIGLAMATLARSYVDLLPASEREGAFRQVCLAFVNAWHTSTVVKKGGEH